MYAPALWNYKAGEKIRVVCYTNCEEAELLLNGKSVGQRKPYDKDTGIIVWDVTYSPGKLEVLAYNNGEQKARGTVETTGKPACISADTDTKDFVNRGDLAHVTVSIRDEQGHIVPFADTELRFELSDNVALLGTENSATRVPDNFKDNVQRCKNGKLLLYVQSLDTSEPAIIRISAPLFEDVVVTID